MKLYLKIESFSNMSDIGMNDNESNDANKNILHSFHALNILSQVFI